MFVLAGGALIFLLLETSGNRRAVGGAAGDLAVPLVSTLLVAPGVLYGVASYFLRRLRRWAWRTTNVMTNVLLMVVVGIGLTVVVVMIAGGQIAYAPGP